METEQGVRLLIVEQRGRDVWRGSYRSLHDAIAAGVAGVGVDKILIQRAIQYEVKIIMVTVEEQRRIFLTPIDDFFNESLFLTRSNYQSRAHRIIPYARWHQKYLGPSLQRKKRIAKTVAS